MVGHHVMIRLIGSEASALSSACTRRNGGMAFQTWVGVGGVFLLPAPLPPF